MTWITYAYKVMAIVFLFFQIIANFHENDPSQLYTPKSQRPKVQQKVTSWILNMAVNVKHAIDKYLTRHWKYKRK